MDKRACSEGRPLACDPPAPRGGVSSHEQQDAPLGGTAVRGQLEGRGCRAGPGRSVWGAWVLLPAGKDGCPSGYGWHSPMRLSRSPGCWQVEGGWGSGLHPSKGRGWLGLGGTQWAWRELHPASPAPSLRWGWTPRQCLAPSDPRDQVAIIPLPGTNPLLAKEETGMVVISTAWMKTVTSTNFSGA